MRLKFLEQFGMSFSKYEGGKFHLFEFDLLAPFIEGDLQPEVDIIVFNDGKAYQWNKLAEKFIHRGEYNQDNLIEMWVE